MATLRAKYEAYLAAPSTGALAENASLNYIPTLTAIKEPTAILRHLSAQQKLLKTKSQRVLSAIESSNGLCVDTETTLELIAGGGAFLPGLDDNFLADKTITFPMIHIVQFDADLKISQIRLYWDQGSLLKQVDVIGARSRSWPIRDGKDQIQLISRSATTSHGSEEPSFARRSGNSGDSVTINRSRGSTVSATTDPHASLSLFAPRDVNADDNKHHSIAPSVARASSAKPPTRDLTDIVGVPEDGHDTHRRIQSPSKMGASKNYGPIRLFDDSEQTGISPDRAGKANPKKFNHFEFGDGEEALSASAKARANVRHQSQWNFEDFVTPDKPRAKVAALNPPVATWDDAEEGEKSPVFKNIVHRARPDAETHFDFVDAGTPADQKPKQRLNQPKANLYHDNVLDQDDTKKPLTTTTNVNASDRARDFAAHYEITDEAASTGTNGSAPIPSKKPTENQGKILKTLDSNWSLFGDEAEIASKENTVPQRKIYKTANDGMGGRKASGRGWGIGDESADEEGAPGRKIYKTANDGMGGRKAGGRGWGIGDDSAGEDEAVQKPRSSRSGAVQKQEEAKGSWDF